MEDIKSVLAILSDDVTYKLQKAEELHKEGETHKAELLQAEAKGIKEAIKDIRTAM